MKSNVGIAIMTMPYAFDKAGWFGGCVLFVIAAALTMYTMRLFHLVMLKHEVYETQTNKKLVSINAPTLHTEEEAHLEIIAWENERSIQLEQKSECH